MAYRYRGPGIRLGREKRWERRGYTWEWVGRAVIPRPGHAALEEQPHPGATTGCCSQEISLPNTSSTRGVSFMLHSGWKERQRYCLECSSLRLRRSASF